MLCEYGCNGEATHQLKNKKWCCSPRTSSCEGQKVLNSIGGQFAYSSGAREAAVDRYDDLPQETKDRMNWHKANYSATEFVHGGRGSHRKALIQERGYKCERCLRTEWENHPIPIELEHMDGDNQNHVKENLKLLCCNCHAITPTWRGRNKNSGVMKVSDSDLLTALQECSNIRQALLKVGLVAKGGNYKRAETLLAGLAKSGQTQET